MARLWLTWIFAYICYMSSPANHQIIRNTVQACLPGARVVLFGSRARGDYDGLSDYDLLVITPATFTAEEKIKWISKIDKALIAAVHMPVDVLLNSEAEVKEKQLLPGHIVRTAIKEGLVL